MVWLVMVTSLKEQQKLLLFFNNDFFCSSEMIRDATSFFNYTNPLIVKDYHMIEAAKKVATYEYKMCIREIRKNIHKNFPIRRIY
jgi:hypothetical protein